MSATGPDASPLEATPAALRLRADPPRIVRLSGKALAVLGAVAALGVGGALIYALQTRGGGKAPAELYNTDSRATAEGLTSGPKDYSQVPQLGPPLPGDLGRPIVSAQARGADVPPPSMGTPAQPDPRAAAAEAARQRRAQEQEAGRMSRLFATTDASRARESPGPSLSTPSLPGPTAPAMPPPSMGGAVPQDVALNGQAAKRAFLTVTPPADATSPARLAAPASPYVLQAGSLIAAALITGVRSDLPGQITAQVTENVYDSPTGKILLIPQGARLIGQYDSEIAAGQNRILLAWDRLILPDGRSIALERLPGADGAGQAGLQDRFDHHWGSVARAALLSTLLGVGAELGSGSDDDLVRALRRGTQDTINQTGQQIVRRQLAIQPTLTVRPGHPLRVIVTRDLVLAPIEQEARP